MGRVWVWVWVRADSDNWVLGGGVELGWAASTAILDLHIGGLVAKNGCVFLLGTDF